MRYKIIDVSLTLSQATYKYINNIKQLINSKNLGKIV